MAEKTRQSRLARRVPQAPEGTFEWLEHWLDKFTDAHARFKALEKEYPSGYTKNQAWYFKDAVSVIKLLRWNALTPAERRQKPRV